MSSFVTSYIPTTSVSVTRAADVAVMPTNVSWYSAATGSLVVEFLQPRSVTQFYSLPSLATDGANALENRIAADTPSTVVFNANSNVGSVSPGSVISYGVRQTLGLSYVASTMRLTTALNGGAVVAGTVTGWPVLSQIMMGAIRQANQNGYVRRITYWNRALSDTEMQQVTT